MGTIDTAFKDTESALRSSDMHLASVRLDQLGTVGSVVTTSARYWSLRAIYALLTLNIPEVERSLKEAEGLNDWDADYFLGLVAVTVPNRLNRRMRIRHLLFPGSERRYVDRLTHEYDKYRIRYQE